MTASWVGEAGRNDPPEADRGPGGRVLRLAAKGEQVVRGVRWLAIPAPEFGWDLESAEVVEATARNKGKAPLRVTLWVVGANGWGAVGDEQTLAPGAAAAFRCPLRSTYPDGTPKLDPTRVGEVRIMVHGAEETLLEISALRAVGAVQAWKCPPGRLHVPGMEEGRPQAGRRVRFGIENKEADGVYSVLFLPEDWEAGQRYPVIAELPGNHFFKAGTCWSSGRPEDCVMGYGISRGRGAIWVSLPFVDRSGGGIAEFGFGSREGLDTVAHTRAVMADLCANWGGDPDRLFLCGFSRGAIACGYIGLRDEDIAGLWKGFIACQHYDGSWGTTMEDAVTRAPRFQGKAIFQVDNDREKYRSVVEATAPEVRWSWGQSGLNYHSPAMFLDGRPLLREVRAWFGEWSAGAEGP